jgi:hypothetical protein
MPMSPSQHDRLVTTHADLILDDERATQVFAVHFETQLRRGSLRALLHRSGRQLARAATALARCYPAGGLVARRTATRTATQAARS